MNEKDSDKIDCLEHRLIEKGCDVTELAVAFSEYLFLLLRDGRVRVDGSVRDVIEYSLTRSAKLLDVTVTDEEKRELRQKMWDLELRFRRLDDLTSNFARCAGNCLFDQADWQQNNDGSDTPLYHYLHFLELVIPGVTSEFLNYFKGRFGILDEDSCV
ncbi:hypothetical protein [Pseudomonas aegrilactucae]|uniref:Uncharacterized protein n=1 Tax=Pseudomonas aegrilactucae TaxID=2854028 RepID=A0A9Q2XI25_9PSED|nr:hypothetical protein [Pseudomonas aegrilactucae]MBV6286734.1 hypothetical protein [Pseudomonas aegrilactucae]